MDDNADWGTVQDDSALEYLPQAVRRAARAKSVFRDYAAVVRAVAVVLRQPGAAGVPTPANVHVALMGQGDRFFTKGGCVEHAMDYVLRGARDQSPLRDGTWDELQESFANEGSPESAAYAAMPAFANDLEFVRVEQMLGLPMGNTHKSSYVGHGNFDEDEEDFDDVDDDDSDMGF
ncbi:hypothetical protein BD413DRAFT_467098 [Trametes elegans]|nr:hypothetical protein BD413DRAFT_467098 [Trametes elegans]